MCPYFYNFDKTEVRLGRIIIFFKNYTVNLEFFMFFYQKIPNHIFFSYIGSNAWIAWILAHESFFIYPIQVRISKIIKSCMKMVVKLRSSSIRF